MTDADAARGGSGVRVLTVADDEAELRLDRWFKRHFPALSHGRLEKLLRTGQVRVDGKRAKAGQRLGPGQSVRVPPLGDDAAKPAERRPPQISESEAKDLRAAVLYRDDDVIAINKPPGLAVQGGSRTEKHLDAMLDALRFDAAERPRLVHRLDRDTSGVLLLGRSARAAAALAKAFRERSARKLYWAITVGVPDPLQGRIDLPLVKRAGRGGERVVAAEPGHAQAQRAVTLYKVIERVGASAAWVAMMPLTGRTHQLRVHAAALGWPILGDGKYGGASAFIAGRPRSLHLHARRLVMPLPGGRTLDVTAPLPRHMAETFAFFGFDADAEIEPFDDSV
jgi:23S rRNA pseudouridine955/2504/2580 synthase